MRELMSWEIDGQRVLSTRKQPTEVARHVVQNRQFRGGFAWEREDSIRERTKSLAPLTADDAGFTLDAETLAAAMNKALLALHKEISERKAK
jgi:hypothetical protein